MASAEGAKRWEQEKAPRWNLSGKRTEKTGPETVPVSLCAFLQSGRSRPLHFYFKEDKA